MRALSDSGMTVRALEDEPVVHADLHWVWDAFWDLDGDRPVGMGVGRIPWSVVDRYAERNDLDFDRLYPLLRALDAVYVQHANKPRPKAT